MNIQETKNQIIKQVNSCRNEEHLESINRMMDNTLRPLLPHDEASVAIFEVRRAIFHRKLAIGLEERRPSDDEI